MLDSKQSNGLSTFFASDIEGSTRLWEEQPEAMSAALVRHDAILRRAITEAGGEVFKTMGDGFFARFEYSDAALAASIAAQRALAEEAWPTNVPIRVRMAMHTGSVESRDGDYFGPTLNRLARLLSVGHGGQVLLSESAVALSRSSLPQEVSLRDLGNHRLKDLDRPEPISMLVHPALGVEFPPLRSLDALPNNLPRQLTSFVGREAEGRQVARLLADNALVTLTGAGGTGKTRLALQTAAESLERFPDGVWLVELAPLGDPALVPQAVASAMGLRESANLSLTATLADALRDRRTLLILDNCEHLLNAVASLVGELLQGAPRLKVVVTSREPLNVGGEAIFRVPSLAVGDGRIRTATEALAHDAVRLLIERAQLSNPRFELTDRLAPFAVQVCRRLDGIPLAIELAASRTKVIALDQIAARLDDRFRLLTAGARTALPRQQTLRATIDWSHDLLDPIDRSLLHRTSVFAGGWTVEAAETVCADEALESWEVLDGLMRLVDKSLVVLDDEVDPPRYRLLESVRQYAAEKLDPSDANAIRSRHAEYFAALVAEAEEGLLGPDQATWLERLEQEHDNVRATLAFCQTSPERCTLALTIIGAIGRFWTVRGYLSEGRDWIASSLSCAPKTPTAERANAYRTAGQIAYWQGDSAAGRRFAEESLAICRELGDREGEARSLFRLGFACLSEEDLPTARTCFEDALRLGREIDDAHGIPHLLNAVGEVAYAEGNYEEAKRYYQEALDLFRKFEDDRSIASALKNLANVACREDDFAAAHEALVEGLRLRRALGNTTGIASTMDAFGILAACQGRFERALFLLAAAHALHEVHGSRPETSEAKRIDEFRAEADAKLGRAEFDATWEAGLNAPFEVAADLAVGDLDPATIEMPNAATVA